MLHGGSFGVLAGAVTLGAIHGIEPGHGWPVAASYALDRTHSWLYGLAASLLIGVGHLISSLAVVGAFFLAKGYFELTRVNDTLALPGGVRIGGPVSIVAGVLLVGLGVREYRHGHGHGDDHGGERAPAGAHPGDGADRDHGHSGHDHGAHDHHDTGDGGLLSRVNGWLPDRPDHAHAAAPETGDRGLFGLAWFAFVLGFAHEEEFEIIALCAGTTDCLELMTAYALAVILGIVGLTMSLIAGYSRAEARLGRYTPYLPAVSAGVLIIMGFGFIAGVL